MIFIINLMIFHSSMLIEFILLFLRNQSPPENVATLGQLALYSTGAVIKKNNLLRKLLLCNVSPC